MYKIKIFLILLFPVSIVSVIYAQGYDLKAVQTGDDVIANYIITNGGKENLEKIKSVKMTGNVDAMGKTLPITVYTSDEYTYTNLDDLHLALLLL
jgi:imidazole glycerol phosphate synthase subunit HisF